MGFVDGEAINFHPGQQIAGPVVEQCFGGNIEHFYLSCTHPFGVRHIFGRAQRAVEENSGNTVFIELAHLVFHQGDQGRNYYR